MKIIKTRGMTNPDSVRSIDPHLLLRLMSRHEDDLRELGLLQSTALTENLAQQLMRSPDGLPMRLVEDIAIIDELTVPTMHQALWRACRQAGIEGATHECSTGDLVVHLLLEAPQHFEQLYAQRLLTTRRAFTFHPAQPHAPLLPRTDDEAEEALRTALEADLVQMCRGSCVRLMMFNDRHELRLVVRRADVTHREAVVEPNHEGPKYIAFKPERFSLLAFDKTTRVLRVHTAHERDRSVLLALVGEHLFGNAAAFSGGTTPTYFELTPILRRGRQIEGAGGVAQIVSATLVAVTVGNRYDDHTKTYRCENGLLLTNRFDPASVGPHELLVHATFEFVLRTGKKCVVRFDGTNKITMSNWAILPTTLEWLRHQGFCNYRMSTTEERQLALRPAS